MPTVRRRSTIAPTPEMTAAARQAAEQVGLDFDTFAPVAPVRAKGGPPTVTWTSTSAPNGRAIVVEQHEDGLSALVTPGIGGKFAKSVARESFIRVRVTDAEKATMEAAAARVGLKTGTWLRGLALRQAGA